MGPSGSGKSTLLDILAGRYIAAEVSGDVRVDGRRVRVHCYFRLGIIIF